MLKKRNGIKTSEETIEGFEIVTEKATELNKKEFFKMLAGTEEGLTLHIDRVGKVITSKYPDKKTGKYPSGIYIDYSFTYNNENYSIGIYYNLGMPTLENEFNLTQDYNIFLILGIAIDLTKAGEIKVIEEFIQNTLTGIKFKAEIGTSYNGTFLIEPVELLE